MQALIMAHKGIGIDLQLSGGKKLTVPAGGSLNESLTGDQVGQVDAYLRSQKFSVPMGPDAFGGRVDVHDAAWKAPPAPGSKVWLEGVALSLVGEAERRALEQRLAALNDGPEGKAVRVPKVVQASKGDLEKYRDEILATSVRLGLSSVDEAEEAGIRGLVSPSVARAAGASPEKLPQRKEKPDGGKA